MGIDPGVTTGVTILTVPIESIIEGAPPEIADKEFHEVYGNIYMQVDALSKYALKLAYPSGIKPVMVYEAFDLDPHYHSRDPELLSPVRLIGAIEYAHCCNHFGNVVLTSQSRQLSKGSATNDRLEAWGLYTADSDHIRDATRQAITFIRRLKMNQKLRRMTWAGSV